MNTPRPGLAGFVDDLVFGLAFGIGFSVAAGVCQILASLLSRGAAS